MTRPIREAPRDPGTSRLRAFTLHEREAGTHPAIVALRNRPQTRGEDNRRAVEYARIERGRLS